MATKHLAELLRADWAANSNNTKGRLICVAYRLAGAASRAVASRPLLKIVGWLPIQFYKVFVNWIIGVELHPNTVAGPGLRLFHGQGLVVHEDVRLGRAVTLRHTTTIGNKRAGGGCPRIGDFVDVGAHSVLIGDIDIGAGAVIGAGSVVTRDVSAGDVVAGNPARRIGQVTGG